MEKFEQKEQNLFEELANRLDELQQEKNGGRGVSCVRDIVFYLRRGESHKAKAICGNEYDKIVNYPDIRKILQQELFSGDDDPDIPIHFKTESNELYDRDRYSM